MRGNTQKYGVTQWTNINPDSPQKSRYLQAILTKASAIDSSSYILIYFLNIASCSLSFIDMSLKERPYSFAFVSVCLLKICLYYSFPVLFVLVLNLINKEKKLIFTINQILIIQCPSRQRTSLHFNTNSYKNILYDLCDIQDKCCKRNFQNKIFFTSNALLLFLNG